MSSALNPDINHRIGERVRTLRAEQGLSLGALAQKTAVSRSMISLIERGESSATAVVLERLAAGLNVPLATLFDSAPADPRPVSRASERNAWRDPGTGYVRRNISPVGFPSSVRIVEVELPPAAQVAYESGPREVEYDQQIWVQTGTLEVTAGVVTYRLDAGDCLAMALRDAVTFRNPTRRRTRYLVVLGRGRPRPTER